MQGRENCAAFTILSFGRGRLNIEPSAMRYIEPHGHMVSRVTDDYLEMVTAGCAAVCEPAFWAGFDRSSVDGFFDYFAQLTEHEPKRAAKFGLPHFTWLCINPKESEDVALAAEVIGIIPKFLDRPTVLGIGENGHLAFIDPPFCDFDDPQQVKVVELDEVCRTQQVNDGAFASIDDVPRRALSLTIPTIMARPRLFAIVPGPAKRQAIRDTIEGPVATTCPASILRRHPDAHLFIDRDSASLLARS